MEVFLIKAFQLILSLAIIVVLHELGHFIPAKIFKTRVEKFYLFFDVKQLLDKLNMNSEQLVIYLLENYGIAMLHGTAMGSAGEGYLRISFANSVENLKTGMNLLSTAAVDILKR